MLAGQSPLSEPIGVGQKRQISLVGQQRVHARIGRHDDAPAHVASLQCRMLRRFKRKVDKPVVHEVDRLSSMRQLIPIPEQLTRIAYKRLDPVFFEQCFRQFEFRKEKLLLWRVIDDGDDGRTS